MRECLNSFGVRVVITILSTVVISSVLFGCASPAEPAATVTSGADAALSSPVHSAGPTARTALSSQEDSAFVSPILAGSTPSNTHRSRSALQSLPMALASARQWRSDAVWYGIVPYSSMEKAFAIPLDDNVPSWFFRFGSVGTVNEYIVEVLDGKVRGVNETSLPDYIEPRLSDLRPLDEKQTLLDSVDVLRIYGDESRKRTGEMDSLPEYVDFRLVHPKDGASPIWILYNARDLTRPILTVDAITGEALTVLPDNPS